VVRRPDQPQVRLVNQGGGVQGLAGLLAGHLGGGQTAQLGVDEREQLGRGPLVPAVRGGQEAGDVGHGPTTPGEGRSSGGKSARIASAFSGRPVRSYNRASARPARGRLSWPCGGMSFCRAFSPSYPATNSGSASAYFSCPSRAAPSRAALLKRR